MGTFLAVSSIIGRTKNDVINSLTNYAKHVTGGLEQIDNIDSETPNCCIVEELNGNVSILYPDGYIEWDASSEFISKELNAVVFSFHIHDGDLWMYMLYQNGLLVDQFNPIPDYWEDNLSFEEINRWKGNAQTISNLIPNIKASEIDQYLIRWDLDEEEPSKAYPTDEFTKEEWQLTDFMTKLKLPYPIDNNGNPKGQTFKLWTSQLKLKPEPSQKKYNKLTVTEKPWWKFW